MLIKDSRALFDCGIIVIQKTLFECGKKFSIIKRWIMHPPDKHGVVFMCWLGSVCNVFSTKCVAIHFLLLILRLKCLLVLLENVLEQMIAFLNITITLKDCLKLLHFVNYVFTYQYENVSIWVTIKKLEHFLEKKSILFYSVVRFIYWNRIYIYIWILIGALYLALKHFTSKLQMC